MLRGPVFAVIRATRSVGWELVSAIALKTDDGHILNLREGSPAMLRNLFRKRWVDIQAIQALGHRFRNCAHNSEEAQDLIDKGIDTLPLKRAFLSKGKQGLKHLEKRSLLKFLSGSSGNFAGEPCSMCGEADSTQHRLWECSHPEVCSFRKHFLSEHPILQKWMDTSASEGNTTIAMAKGWFPAPQPHVRPEGETHVVFPLTPNQPFRFLPDLPIFTDGSCFNGTDSTLAVAGVALVQMCEGNLVRSLQVTLPRWVPATAAAGEHMAPVLASLYSDGPHCIITDCSSVYASAMQGANFALHWSRPMAGMWQDVRFGHLSAKKTKAHRSKQQAIANGDLDEWVGNLIVDELAKEAAAVGAPSPDVIRARASAVTTRVAFYHYASKLLQLWLPNSPAPHRAKAIKEAPAVRLGHDLEWLPFLHKWGCRQCLKVFRNRTTSARCSCSGLSPSAAKSVNIAQGHGHQLMVCNYVQMPGTFMFCNRCGCYSQLRVIGLGRACVGKSVGQPHSRHKRIQDGKHPITGALLGKPRLLPIGRLGMQGHPGAAAAGITSPPGSRGKLMFLAQF